MADVQQQLHHTQIEANQSLPLTSNTPSLPTPALEDRPPKRRASLSPIERQLAAAASGSRNMDIQKKARNTSSSYKGNNMNSRGSVMTMPGMIGGEITYTPTTHRISKAKKGKKVHACEFPGCTKVCCLILSRCRVVVITANDIADLHTGRASQVCHGALKLNKQIAANVDFADGMKPTTTHLQPFNAKLRAAKSPSNAPTY